MSPTVPDDDLPRWSSGLKVAERDPMAKDIERTAATLAKEARVNTRWRRTECINLIPSEQPFSAYVAALTISDPAARYNEHSRSRAPGSDAADIRYYKVYGD